MVVASTPAEGVPERHRSYNRPHRHYVRNQAAFGPFFLFPSSFHQFASRLAVRLLHHARNDRGSADTSAASVSCKRNKNADGPATAFRPTKPFTATQHLRRKRRSRSHNGPDRWRQRYENHQNPRRRRGSFGANVHRLRFSRKDPGISRPGHFARLKSTIQKGSAITLKRLHRKNR